MAYKCLECGHVFEDGEEFDWREAHGESFSGCPLCHGAYRRTIGCNGCGSEHLQDELIDGWCRDCLLEELNYKTFLEFFDDAATQNGDIDDFCEFVLTELLNMDESDVPTLPSAEFYQAMRFSYCMHAELAEGDLGYVFLPRCEAFFDDIDAWDGFAEWLNKTRRG